MEDFLMEDPLGLPFDGQYYFFVTVFAVAIDNDDFMGEGIEQYVYIDHLTDPRPWIIFFYRDFEKDFHVYLDCVVEVSESYGVGWWRGEEFDSFELL